jgi:hypothetical protein
MDTLLFFVVLVAWPIAAWAMIMMLITALKNCDQFKLGWFFSGAFVLERYNRKYFWIFTAAIAAMVAIVILYNVLFLMRAGF